MSSARKLTELGFSGDEAGDAIPAEVAGASYVLPAEYVQFLRYRPIEDLDLGYTFVDKASGETWEGQVTEFASYPRGVSSRELISPPPSDTAPPHHSLLPIASDAGGNWVCLDLATEPARVVDLNYQTGAVSVIARSFAEFLDSLFRREE